MTNDLRLVRVEPQPTFIESSGRWCWPLPEQARRPGCAWQVVTASREWWEYTPSEAKPHPFAEGVRLRDDVWYWAIPDEAIASLRQEARCWRALLDAPHLMLVDFEARSCGTFKATKQNAIDRHLTALDVPK